MLRRSWTDVGAWTPYTGLAWIFVHQRPIGVVAFFIRISAFLFDPSFQRQPRRVGRPIFSGNPC